MKDNNTFFYPNITTLPQHTETILKEKNKQNGTPSEFENIFENALKEIQTTPEIQNLEYIKPPLKFSAHAAQRLKDRKIHLDTNTLLKVHDAIDLAASKGIEDSLILTPETAFIVSIKNRTVITAVDRNDGLGGNVFTHIDGAIVV